MGQGVDWGGARRDREFSLAPPRTRLPGLTWPHSQQGTASHVTADSPRGESDTGNHLPPPKITAMSDYSQSPVIL
jgi:hypothetical protein